MPGSKARDSSGALKGRVLLGKVAGVHGLKGWLKLHSYTEPRERIFEYQPLIIGGQKVSKYDGKVQGKGLLLHMEGRDDRTSVEPLLGAAVEVERDQASAVALVSRFVGLVFVDKAACSREKLMR